MLVKLVVDDHREVTYDSVTHVVKTEKTDVLEVELMPNGPTIRLPEDGDTIYLMNDRGETLREGRLRFREERDR